jgi:hypothetical protein
MKSNRYACCILFLFFIVCISHLTIGQKAHSAFVNNSITNVNLSGLYVADNQDKYYLKQLGNSLWWIGTDKNTSNIKNIFKGIIYGNNIQGQWIASPMNLTTRDNGSLNMTISFTSPENVSIDKVSSNYNFPLNQLVKFNSSFQTFPQFMVSIDNINVNNSRSPLYDDLYVGLSAMKYDNDPLISTNYFTHSEGNSNLSLNLMVGPFEFNQNDKGLAVEFVGLNKANVEPTSTLINLKEILTQLFDTSFNSYNLSNSNQADFAILSLSPDLHLYACNGVVFADKIFISSEELKQLLINGTYSQEKTYIGNTSPNGCGPNSVYQVKWSIIPIK